MDTWEKALEIMKNDISVPSYETLFKPVRLEQETEDTVFLKVPSEFVKEMLLTRFSSLIESTLSQIRGKETNIELIVEEIRKEPAEPPVVIPDNLVLNKAFTFDEFVVGQSNRFAHAACLSVSKNPGKIYNPLYIYGKVGLGKTHLLHATAWELVNTFRDSLKVMYRTTEEFTNEVIRAIQNAHTNGDLIENMHRKYRSVDVLLVDDVQFLKGKERTQEEFFHIFNALYHAGKQIIITSDCLPKEIPTLEDRLRSRFECGLIVDIGPPDTETRIAILRKKAARYGVTIKDEVFYYIADNVKGNVRELEGSLVRVIAKASLMNEDITRDFAEKALKDIINPGNEPITIDRIKRQVAAYFGLNPEDLDSKKRDQKIVFPRQVAMYFARHYTDASLPQIGDSFGGKDHTTVMHSIAKIEEGYNREEALRAIIDEIKSKIE